MTSGMEPQGVVLETPLQSRRWGWLVVFTTTSTLLCCALPIALVSLGLGATVASLAANLPWLVTLSMYKGWVFAISGLLILTSAYAVFRPGRACPTYPHLAAACARADTWNQRLVGASACFWGIGFTAAYVLPLTI